MVRFDAYSATLRGQKHEDLAQLLIGQVGTGRCTVHAGNGHHTFGHRLAVKDESGSEVGSVQWGGRQGDRLMIEVKGERTPGAVEAIRALGTHRVTRVDACADFDAPGTFEALLVPFVQVKKAHRLKGSKLGDWEDFPEDGRTMYLGAPSSSVRVRLYEKGKQPEFRHLAKPDWTRIEVQARPLKDAKTGFAALTPLEVWGASTWTRDLAGKVLEQHIDPHPAGTVYRLSQRDAALRWMCKQYGSHLISLADDLGGWEVLGLTLNEMLQEQKRRKF